MQKVFEIQNLFLIFPRSIMGSTNGFDPLNSCSSQDEGAICEIKKIKEDFGVSGMQGIENFNAPKLKEDKR